MSELPEAYLEPKLAPPKASRNRLIMLRFLEGQTIEEIAEYFQLQPSTISGILNSPLVKQEMDSLSAKMAVSVVERVSSLSDEAIDVVKDTMRGKLSSELKFKAANSLLDRNPELSVKKGSDAQELMAGLGEGMIKAISKQIREIERENEDRTKSGFSEGFVQEIVSTSEVDRGNDSVCDTDSDGK